MNSHNTSHSCRILIVEDEKVTALDLKLTLEDLGYEVVACVSSGEAAIAAATEQNVDLILMDIHLDTAMLGTEAAKIIMQKTGIPVLFLSAYSDDQTLDDASDSLPYGYMVKPFEKREVDAAIRIALARYSADLELRRSEERLRLALEAARMSIWEWTPDNDEDIRLNVSHTPPQLISESLDDLLVNIHPDDRDKIHKQIGSHQRHQQPVRFRKHEGNDYRWVELFASLFRWENGDRRVIGVLHDVHERYLADEQLRQANAVFNSTSEGILITDAQRRVLNVNPAFSQITGYTQADVQGKNPDEFLHARRHSDQFYPRLINDAQGYWSGEIACQRKNGEFFQAWEHVCTVLSDDGQLQNFVITFSDISELRRVEKNLATLAYMDALTGVGNRVRLEQVVSDALADGIEAPGSVGILYLDLDGFKLINDTLGHSEGDLLLRVMADRFKQTVRDEDTVVRIGGDEFVIVITNAEQEDDLKVVAEKLLQAVQQPVSLSREKVEVSASIGIVLSRPSVQEYEELLKAADTALFEAKRQGKNRYCIYDFALAMEFNERLRIERSLKQAIRNDELALEFQPLIDLQTSRVYGVEALCRWYHNELGMIPPDRFIPIAEQSDVIVDIGSWVLRESCRVLRGWMDSGLPELKVSVNVSARQLTDSRFAALVSRVLTEFNIAPEQLELEITETALQANEQILRQLEHIHKSGVGLAIDDFGTGYSSLSRLKELTFDRVKIDRSFVRDLPHSSNDIEICRAVMALCQVLSLQVTAEGVENHEQLDMLRELGCHCIQGYLFSRPLRPELLADWIRQTDIAAVLR
ncbi:EAL domain-containing protein [Thalassolituus hydrocarboniclasticus]|uniref:EAL domain-containing protein n=1 Tax=Thalassolituus hydrocarboniclasticus TaxID=2742796 RepID=A0ABY6A9M1_9GAMM|nr:EAL domain-containing protein [Thalassolituus hydrocarboniclasticus]